MSAYPRLMAYIEDRSAQSRASDWCDQLRTDENAAEAGELADVAAELAQAQADYKAQQEAKGCSGFPYNSAVGQFLGLPINPGNNEPPHGYYMANCVMHHYRLGVAKRRVQAMIDEGRELAIVTGRSKADRKPVRFARFKGDQITIQGNTVTLNDGKRLARLNGNWSTETCLEAVERAMAAGVAYGEAAP